MRETNQKRPFSLGRINSNESHYYVSMSFMQVFAGYAVVKSGFNHWEEAE